jgi:acetolactate synthase-1/2/3 large subunit
MKYSDQIADWLVELGYTHCFFLGGGNVMHLVESFSRKLTCIPVIHEVSAGIAAEYFNQTSDSAKKAVALVTAGPGMTNIVTAMAGAFLESRELLVIGGQVKSSDLAHGKLRQNGIQEIDGVSIAKPISVASECMLETWEKSKFLDFVCHSSTGRKGPVFLEMPLDIQAKEFDSSEEYSVVYDCLPVIDDNELGWIVKKINHSLRPVIMLGGGVDFQTVKKVYDKFERSSVPIVTTWNGADRIGSDHPNYIGRPNTWGQRSANILVQQSDLLIAIGTRLGMQQTGFNWQEFLPEGEIIQVDIDRKELEKAHPKIEKGLCVDANDFLLKLYSHDLGNHEEWLDFCRGVRKVLPLEEEKANSIAEGYVSPHKLISSLSRIATSEDIVIPCSSGGAFTTMYQMFEQKFGQRMVSDKGLASMGYGLAGAIGASIANPNKRVILVEGDGGFAQNLQEIGTASINDCNLKIFLFDDEGYASIRMTQRSYFKGKYVGCDIRTGLGLPNWEKLFSAWNIKTITINSENYNDDLLNDAMQLEGLLVFIVKIDPEQTYFPKITSKVTDSGSMISNPLHIMSPLLDSEVFSKVYKYIKVL